MPGHFLSLPDKLGTLRYGSPVMNVTADRTAELAWPPPVTTTRSGRELGSSA